MNDITYLRHSKVQFLSTSILILILSSFFTSSFFSFCKQGFVLKNTLIEQEILHEILREKTCKISILENRNKL